MDNSAWGVDSWWGQPMRAETFPHCRARRREAAACGNVSRGKGSGSSHISRWADDLQECRKGTGAGRFVVREEERRSRPAHCAATRPASPLYLQNYTSVIPPRLWKTLWITREGGCRRGLFPPLRMVMPTLCTVGRRECSPLPTGLDRRPGISVRCRLRRGRRRLCAARPRPSVPVPGRWWGRRGPRLPGRG